MVSQSKVSRSFGGRFVLPSSLEGLSVVASTLALPVVVMPSGEWSPRLGPGEEASQRDKCWFSLPSCGAKRLPTVPSFAPARAALKSAVLTCRFQQVKSI